MRTRRQSFRIVILALFPWLAASTALALPIKTDTGQTVLNWVFKKSYTYMGKTGPGSIKEDGAKVVDFTSEDLVSDADKKSIRDADKKAHPSIAFVDGKDATPEYDCHGLTFKMRGVWIDDDQVDKILKGQGWEDPKDGKAKKGDIVIYRDDKGKAIHSGIVEAVDNQGKVTRVRSKWGERGEYIHDPTDTDYGTKIEVKTGGKPLKDPPHVPDDLSDFERAGIPPVSLKSSLVGWGFNTFLSALLDLSGHVGGTFDYHLRMPGPGLNVTPGDTLSLYATGILSAQTLSDAAGASFGGWQVTDLSSSQVTWTATTSAFVSGDLTGFEIQSALQTTGQAFFRETVAGDIGRTTGPAVVPEPGTVVLLSAGLFTLGVGYFRRGRRAG